MLNELKQVFSIKGSLSFFYDMEDILGRDYMEGFYTEQIEYCGTSDELATALANLIDDEQEEIYAYYKDAGLTEAEQDKAYEQLQEKLAQIKIG